MNKQPAIIIHIFDNDNVKKHELYTVHGNHAYALIFFNLLLFFVVFLCLKQCVHSHANIHANNNTQRICNKFLLMILNRNARTQWNLRSIYLNCEWCVVYVYYIWLQLDDLTKQCKSRLRCSTGWTLRLSFLCLWKHFGKMMCYYM